MVFFASKNDEKGERETGLGLRGASGLVTEGVSKCFFYNAGLLSHEISIFIALKRRRINEFSLYYYYLRSLPIITHRRFFFFFSLRGRGVWKTNANG